MLQSPSQTHFQIIIYEMFQLTSSIIQETSCSVTKSCLTLCDPLDCSTPGLTVFHYLPEFAQIQEISTEFVFPWWPNDKECTCQCRRPRFDTWVGKIPWRRKWQPTPVFLPGKSHGQRSLVGYGPQRVGHGLVTKQQIYHALLINSSVDGHLHCLFCLKLL